MRYPASFIPKILLKYNNFFSGFNYIFCSSDLQLEDEGEKFERLHEQLLMEDPDSVAFQNARMRTDRRKTYERAMSQTQPIQKQAKKPGTPTKIMTNRPPAKMEIQIR